MSGYIEIEKLPEPNVMTDDDDLDLKVDKYAHLVFRGFTLRKKKSGFENLSGRFPLWPLPSFLGRFVSALLLVVTTDQQTYPSI